MVNAQRASSKIMTEANDRADIIINTARKSCDRILADFRKKIQEERAILNSLNQAISEFKDKLFKTYNLHISHIEGIELLDENEIVKYSLSDDSYTSAVVQNIKQEIVGMVNSASDDSSVVLQGTEGFVEVDVPQAESVVRTASVKDTIKELNKRFLSDEEDSVRPVLSTSDDDKEIAETLKKIGAGEVIDIEKSPDAVAGGSAKGMSDFEKAYQTPKDYGEIIKKRLKK